MVRDLNNACIEPLAGTCPSHRLGMMGDVAKVNCTTCHQGEFKPLKGESMLKDYPETGRRGSPPARGPLSGVFRLQAAIGRASPRQNG
jgi:photosynthetic reaction center cytochrome c subunit